VKKGFDVGELDGVYGRYTKQAVIDFQKSQKNLVVDGIPGEKTLALLRNSSGVASTTLKSAEQNTPNNSQINSQPINSQPSNQNNNQTNSNGSDRNEQRVKEPVIVTNNNPQITESGDMGNLQMLLKQRRPLGGDCLQGVPVHYVLKPRAMFRRSSDARVGSPHVHARSSAHPRPGS
jgi:hypothetical protein